jgi:hypothetical protein
MGDGFNLLPQAADVNVNRPWGHEAVAAPDLVQQPIAVEDMTRVRSQIVEELEFQRTQLHQPAAHGHLLSSRIEPKVSHVHHLPLFRDPLLPAQNRSDPRYKLPRTEGLDHIVVPSYLQAQNSIHFLTLGREENYRQSPQTIVGAKALANVKTVVVRQQNIQKDYVDRVATKIIQPLTSSPETLDLEPFLAKVVAN